MEKLYKLSNTVHWSLSYHTIQKIPKGIGARLGSMKAFLPVVIL